MKSARAILLLAGFCCKPAANAQVTVTTYSTADAFLCTGSPQNPELGGADLSGYNFGAAGTLVVNSAASSKGEFQSVVQFDLSAFPAAFNSTYGSNHWLISSIFLQLASNYGRAGVQPDNAIFPAIAGGQFTVVWLSNNGWIEGTGKPNMPTMDGVDYDSNPDLLSQPSETLCTNTYTPPGNDIFVTYTLPASANLVSNICAGSLVSFLFQPADNKIAYLFNSHEFAANEPTLEITAMPLIKILSGTLAGGSFLLTGVGPDNSTFQIQSTTNMASTDWQTIGTADSDSEGNIQFAASISTSLTQQFYRITQSQ